MASKVRLSKGILEMKFMKRTRDKIIKEEDDAESRAMYSNEITDKMLHGNSQFILEHSFVPCENLMEGRFSFRGMNPEIERLLELEMYERQITKAKMEKDNGTNQKSDVSNVEMTKFYKKLKMTNNSQQINYGKRKKMKLPKPVNESVTFLKPKD